MHQPNSPVLIDAQLEEYCENYRLLFSRSRDFDAFKALHVAMLADIGHKSLKAIANAIEFTSYGGLRDFFNDSSWEVQALRQRRLDLTLNKLNQQSFVLVIQEVGIPKKGKSTDYVMWQDMPNLGRRENGLIVLITYGVCQERVFPLMFEVFKPRDRLRPGDRFKTKTQLAIDMIEQLLKLQSKIEVVLLDGFCGDEWSSSLNMLDGIYLDYIITVRPNYQDRLKLGQIAWEEEIRIQLDANILEFLRVRGARIVKRPLMLYWEVDKVGLKSRIRDDRWLLLTQVQDIDHQTAGRYYQMKEQIEWFSKRMRSRLGWNDFQMTEYFKVEKWWETNMSVQILELALKFNF